MNSREFFDLVRRMRQAQRTYFETRGSGILAESKMLEREVDAEIGRVMKIIAKRNEELLK